jgi:hypothetical protein
MSATLRTARRLPAPIRPRRRRRMARAVRAVRAENIRRWLALGPLPFAELVRDMQCTRFALSKTLTTMPDVRITYQTSRPRRAVVECVA